MSRRLICAQPYFQFGQYFLPGLRWSDPNHLHGLLQNILLLLQF
jgi:hypothetical protein